MRSMKLRLAALLACSGISAAFAQTSAFAPSVAFPQASALADRLIVRIKPKATRASAAPAAILSEMRKPLAASTLDRLSAGAGVKLEYLRPLADGGHILVPRPNGVKRTTAQIAAALRETAGIERVDIDRAVRPFRLPSDQHYPYLWNLKPISFGSFGADFQSAWDITAGTRSTVVAIIDTGLTAHPDLVGNGGSLATATGNVADPGYDFISDCRIRGTCAATTPDAASYVAPQAGGIDRGDWVSTADRGAPFFSQCQTSNSSWHGTHVAGVVAAISNETGIAGAAHGVALLPVRVLGKCGGYLSDVAEGVRWAAGVHPTIPNPKPARVLNLSLGADGSCDATLQSAIDAAVGAGATVVVAAGNESMQAEQSVLPSCKQVITVAASTQAGDLAYYSNRSKTHVHVSAPGGDMRGHYTGGILSAWNSGATAVDAAGWGYAFAQGTSSAAPHVSAVAALMASRNPDLTPGQIRAVLTAPNSVTPFPTDIVCATEGVCGAGLLNARRALENSVSVLQASSDVLDYGSLPLMSAAIKELFLSNPSLVSVRADTVQLSGSSGFGIDADECSNRTLAPGGRCRLSVLFHASEEGTATGSITLPLNGGDSQLTVGLSATAGSKLSADKPYIRLDPLTVGELIHVDIRFSNRAARAERIASVTLDRIDIAAIAEDRCTDTDLEPGASCSVRVALSPSQSGDFQIKLAANTGGVGDVAYVAVIGGSATNQGVAALPSPDQSSLANTGNTASAGGGCSLRRAGAGFDPLFWVMSLIAAARIIRKRCSNTS